MSGILGNWFGGDDAGTWLMFFILLVIVFCNSGCFGDGDELLFFFLILIFLFSGGNFFGGL